MPQQPTSKKIAEQEAAGSAAVRKRHYIRVIGDQIPAPEDNFDNLFSNYSLPTKLLHNITVLLQYQEPTPIQMQCIPALLRRRNLLAYAPTGSGKSLAYLLPIVANLLAADESDAAGGNPLALVLLPTVELAKQVLHCAKQLAAGLGVRAAFVRNAEAPPDPAKLGRAQLLVSTPQRLIYLLRRGAVSLGNVRHLVLDESDRLLQDEGPSGFREQLGAVGEHCTHPGMTRALFSATAHPLVEAFCRENFDDLVVVRVGPKQAATGSIEQKLVFCANEFGKAHEVKMMFHRGDFRYPLLLFAHTRERANELCRLLRDQGVTADCVTAGKPQETRDRIVRRFRAGKLPVLVSTDLMARGMDFPDVAMVINYDLPAESREYIHRIGRCGRCGRHGLAVSFWERRDMQRLRPVLAVMRNSGCDVNQELYRLLLAQGKQRRPHKQQKQQQQQQQTGGEKAGGHRGHVFGGVRAVKLKKRQIRDDKKRRRKAKQKQQQQQKQQAS